jgi:uncharacterized protein DUF6636
VRRLLPALLVVLPLAACPAAAGGIEFFRTPSKNIGCVYSTGPAYLRCDVLSGLKPEPRGKCELDWTGLELAPTGRARPTCAGDTAYDNRSPILGYGKTWKRGGLRCVSRTTGLTCRNRSGHGFVLSRKAWRVF